MQAPSIALLPLITHQAGRCPTSTDTGSGWFTGVTITSTMVALASVRHRLKQAATNLGHEMATGFVFTIK